MSQFIAGAKVALAADEDNPYEEGVVLADEGDELYIVQLDPKYITDPSDDGVREVLGEQLQARS